MAPPQAQHVPVMAEGTAGSWLGVVLVVAVQLGRQVLERRWCWGPWGLWRAMQLEQEDWGMVGMNCMEFHWGKAMPLIFVGGVPQRGTMLDAHANALGRGDHTIPRMLAVYQAWAK